jgi:hypothetical protein
MITSRTLIATFGAAAAALLAMASLSLARPGAEAVQAAQGGLDAAVGMRWKEQARKFKSLN